MTGRRMLTVAEVAAETGRSKAWVRARIGAGDLPARKIARVWYVAEPDLDAWVAGGSTETTPDAVYVIPAVTPPPLTGRRGCRRVA